MNRKLEILHALNILSFLLTVTYVYGWRYMVLLDIMLAMEIIAFGFGIRYTLLLRNYGEDDERRRYFQKSRWYTLFSLLFIVIYFFILYWAKSNVSA